MKTLVSVIIPVFNVEKYIDQCLKSVTSQTYPCLEILVMEGKSTDKSLEKVLNWAKKDNRINVTSRKDGGLGEARNYGSNIAKGEYLFFLDSDDWISENTIADLVAMAENDSEIDYVQADVVNVINGETDLLNNDSEFVCESFVEKKCEMYIGYNFAWGKLFRTDFYKANGFVQPALPCEDLTIYPAIVAKARKIGHCNSAKVFYRLNRKGSLSQTVNEYIKFPEIMKYAKDELKRLNCYDQYKDIFQYTMFRYFRRIIVHGIGEKGFYNLKYESPEIYEFGKREFSQYDSFNYWVFGSFSLRWISHRFANHKDGLTKHFAFTSIIAQMSQCSYGYTVNHENSFRRESVNNDIAGFVNWNGPVSPNIILIDLLQECTDIAQLEDRNYISLTEALRESSFNRKICKIISWNSLEFWNLWKEKCTRFIEVIEKRFKLTKIILVKSYFADKYRENGKLISYGQSMQSYNEMLSKMYQFFEERMQSVIVIDTEGIDNYTDTVNQGYVSVPEYHNEKYYDYVLGKILRILEDGTK